MGVCSRLLPLGGGRPGREESARQHSWQRGRWLRRRARARVFCTAHAPVMKTGERTRPEALCTTSATAAV